MAPRWSLGNQRNSEVSRMDNTRTAQRRSSSSGGQAGLSVGYCLRQRGLSFVTRPTPALAIPSKRWDSLRLFTGQMRQSHRAPVSGAITGFPSKDEMADYLGPTLGMTFRCARECVERLCGATARTTSWTLGTSVGGDHVVVAMASYPAARIPGCPGLDPDIRQLHSASRARTASARRCARRQAASSGQHRQRRAVAVIVARGPASGHIPFRISPFSRLLPFLFHRLPPHPDRADASGRRVRPSIISGAAR
jgi:hypothetical protein